jgi:hypothetical protein
MILKKRSEANHDKTVEGRTKEGVDLMTDYVISEELLKDIKICLEFGCDGTLPNERELLKAVVDSSRPLHEHDAEIRMKERERIHNLLDYMKHVDNEKEYYVTVYLGDVRDIVNDNVKEASHD